MEKDVNCNVCGGTDFFIEAGHYYCGECQTQSQDIREHVFATGDEGTAGRNISFKRVRTEKKSVDQLTSWECYNYIILGLVNELIELGAGAKLKQNVHFIWFKYLQSLEVISDKSNVPPRLSAVNSQKDAQIVYGRKAHKRGRTSRTPSPSGSSEVSSMDTTSRREKSKQKRSMILSQYDEFSTQQSEDATSTQNQSLISLRSGSDSSKDRDKFLQYNKTAKKELLKIMTKNHLKVHCRDVTSLLECHKLTYRALSSKYVHGANVISRNKIYAVIYLGLLINKDNIQLGDMLRFIREGKLSYYDVKHFFPEEYEEKNLNIKSWNSGRVSLTHCGMRKVAAEIAKQVGIVRFICRQDLAALCQRYCCELNLPDQVWGYSLNLMSRALPQMHFTNKSKFIPNYEGRVMSIIIFVLKLFFGLDEVTEEKFTSYAETINNLNKEEDQKMFVWKNWAYYIKYRKLVLIQHHFPTEHLLGEDGAQNPDLFINFANEQNLKHEQNNPSSREVEVLQNLLEKLRDRQDPPKTSLDFKASLTPFRDYIQTLLDSQIPTEKNYLIDVLNSSFKTHSFNFLITPLAYLQELNKNAKVGIKHRGANNDLKMIKIPNFKVKRECWRNAAKHEVLVKLINRRIPISGESSTDHLRETKNIEQLNSKEIITNFSQTHRRTYKKNLRKLVKTQERRQGSRVSQLDETVSSQTSQMDRRNYIHYNPYDRYWLKNIDVENISKEEYLEFIQTFPDSFQLVLNECARIIEQSPKSLFEEFLNVEIFLCYIAEFTRKDKFRDKIVNKDLVRFINRAKKNW